MTKTLQRMIIATLMMTMLLLGVKTIKVWQTPPVLEIVHVHKIEAAAKLPGHGV